jgi:apolipoprotein D and lipocalin family protein
MRYFLFLALAFAAIVAVCVSVSASAKSPPLVSRASVELPRYMGRWWVIANIPYFAENGKLASADIYALRPDGKIDNVFVYRKGFEQPEKQMHAVATVVPGTRNTQWKVAFFGGLLRADYLVLEVAPDYSWALIGQPSRKLAWVFSREQRMDDARLAELTAKFRHYGYDPGKLKRVRQFPDQ